MTVLASMGSTHAGNPGGVEDVKPREQTGNSLWDPSERKRPEDMAAAR